VAGRPAVFLDRDGTLMVECGYLSDPAGVALLPGAAAALRRLADAGHALVLVTNQSGIARGLYDEAAFRSVQQRLETLLAAEGVRLDGVYMCPHHPDHSGPCPCRKPGLALFQAAVRELGLDPAASAFVGDRLRDVVPALAFGGLGILVRTGYGAAEAGAAPAEVVVVEDLAGVADLLAGRAAAG
jgi:D-glycero-D-manno-heptose 1,7-bisphosphate phosphatase